MQFDGKWQMVSTKYIIRNAFAMEERNGISHSEIL